MRIFVASWFYVPVTTSEALVTYKLLSSSENNYVVCSAKSNKWSYNKESELKSDNIEQFIIDTDSFDEYVEKTFEIYKELSKKEKFDAIMTRSLPPESQLVGLKIKEIDKEIPWIISLGDPIANNPYETFVYLMQNRHKLIRNLYFHAPHFFLDKICPLIKRPNFAKLSELNVLEKTVINAADVVITPTEEQAKFIMHNEEIYNKKSLVVPHSYCEKLYPKTAESKNEKFTFTFIGHSDFLRSVEPIVKALNILKELNPEILNKIKIRFVGNIPSKIKDMVYVFFLQDIVSIEEPCDYFRSLEIMQESDCLIHIDAFFHILNHGSIFFAAKIADYLGAKKPILGITDKLSPAGKIISTCGGECCSDSPYDIAKNIVKIVDNQPKINIEEAEKYESKQVAKNFDKELERKLLNNGK